MYSKCTVDSMGEKTGGSDVMNLTVNEGVSKERKKSSRVCEMDVEQNLSQTRAIGVGCEEINTSSQEWQFKYDVGRGRMPYVVIRRFMDSQ